MIFVFLILLIACLPEEPIPQEDKEESSEGRFYDEGRKYFSSEALLVLEPSHEKAELGRLLFYDTRLSKDNSISCATCHRQQLAFSDGRKNSLGFSGELTLRNSMSLTNIGFHPSVFWDVSGEGLENDVLKPITNHIEMGMDSIEEVISKLGKDEMYLEHFNLIYEDGTINSTNIGDALSQFIGALISYRSKFDVAKTDDFASFTQDEILGMELYFGKAMCSRCHSEPFFAGDRGVAVNIGLDLIYEDKGAGNGKFKVPTLRNIALTSPYMHDGRFSTLDEVVGHYNNGIQDHTHLSSQLKDPKNDNRPVQLQLSAQEKAALVSFLNTLTDWSFINDPKFSDPF